MAGASFATRVARVRRFNRFYTKHIGVLQEHLLHTSFSLTEARVVYELAHHDATTATALGAELGLDAGYLSRIVRSFARRGLLEKRRDRTDARQTLLRLSPRGHRAFAKLNRASHGEIGAMLRAVPGGALARLLKAMQTIEDVLGARREAPAPYTLRPPRPGDMGWVVECHGTLYAQEYGWDQTFEGLVAEIVARFVRRLDPKRERCWIAEQNGVNVGCVFLVKKTATVGQLRLLLVEPSARGFGIGHRLVDECTRFARAARYRKIVLWTNSVLHAARRIYERAGYRLTEEERHHSFGHELVGQTWELKL